MRNAAFPLTRMWDWRASSVSKVLLTPQGLGSLQTLMWDLCLIPGRVLSLYSAVKPYSARAVCLSTSSSHLLFSLIPVSLFTHVGAHSTHLVHILCGH